MTINHLTIWMCAVVFLLLPRCLCVQIIHLPSPFYFWNLHNFSLVVVIEWTIKSVWCWWEHEPHIATERRCVCCAMSQWVWQCTVHALTVGVTWMFTTNATSHTPSTVLVNPHHGFISGQNGMGRRRRCCCCCFFICNAPPISILFIPKSWT